MSRSTVLVLVFHVLLVGSTVGLAACGGAGEADAATFTLTPGTLEARRDPAGDRCGRPELPFGPLDLFTLRAIDARVDARPVRVVAVTSSGPIVAGTRYDLAPRSDGAVLARAELDRDGMHVTLEAGILGDGNRATAPESRITSAAVTFEALPQVEGARLTERIELELADGSRLDQTFSAPLASSLGSCGTM